MDANLARRRRGALIHGCAGIELDASQGRIDQVAKWTAEVNVDRIRFQVPDSKADIAAERLSSPRCAVATVSASSFWCAR